MWFHVKFPKNETKVVMLHIEVGEGLPWKSIVYCSYSTYNIIPFLYKKLSFDRKWYEGANNLNLIIIAKEFDWVQFHGNFSQAKLRSFTIIAKERSFQNSMSNFFWGTESEVKSFLTQNLGHPSTIFRVTTLLLLSLTLDLNYEQRKIKGGQLLRG